jgi:hypothetical protein
MINRALHKNSALRKACTILFLAAGVFAGPAVQATSEPDQIELISVVPAEAPIISEKRVSYKVDFLFDRCPAEYWWYFDAATKRVTIELYDCFVKVEDTITIKPVPPVKEIEFKNASTAIVISGKKSQIFLRLKEELHCEAVCSNDTLHVVLWKELSSKQIVRKKRWLPKVVPALLVVACAAATVAYFKLSVPQN